jgi:MinD-like ATPase involved in chromosome partitioning or flagellar assembly
LQSGSTFEPAYAKGGLEFFRYVEDGRMAYVGSLKDDTKKIVGREPLLLREWAKLHANELLEIAGVLVQREDETTSYRKREIPPFGRGF